MAGKILQGPAFKNPVPEKTVGQLFFEKSLEHEDKIFQVDGTTNTSETHASVRLRSTRVAIELKKKKVNSKDVVAFFTKNSLDTVIPMFATFYLGAKVANFEPSFSLKQTQHLISLVSPKIIFVEESSVVLIEDSLKEAQITSDIIVYGQSSKYPTFADLSREQNNEENFKPLKVDMNDVALILSSSGTTGLPKAIHHTHSSYVHIACGMRDYNMGEVLLHFSNFYWITTHMLMLTAIMTGGSIVFLRSFDLKAVYKTIEKYKVNGIFAVSFIINKLIKFSEANIYNTLSVTQLLTGGANFNPMLIKKILEIFPRAAIIHSYGLSEIAAATCFLPECHQELIQKKPFSCGKPFYGNKIKIVDKNSGKVLGAHERGEICLSSPCLFQGYSNTNYNYFDNDGFFKTGDIGYYDEEDCLFLVGRIKEMFDYQDFHIAPAEIEVVLLEHHSVEEAVVFGIPWGEDGEVPGACIVLKNDTTTTNKEIINFVAERVPDRMKLRGGVMFVTSLLKTPTGKVMRNDVKNYFIANCKINNSNVNI